MGILDDAKDKLGDAAGWVKDRAEQIGDQAQGTGQSLGGKAADARHWVETRIGGERAPESSGAAPQAPESSSAGEHAPESRTGGGGDFTNEWVDASTDSSADAPQADPGPDGEAAAEGEPSGDRPV